MGSNSSIHKAVHDNDIDRLERLISRGGNIEERDDNGNTPLGHAARKGKLYVLKSLVGMKANIEAEDKKGKTALDRAKERGHSNIVAFLSNQKARIKAEENARQKAKEAHLKRKEPEEMMKEAKKEAEEAERKRTDEGKKDRDRGSTAESKEGKIIRGTIKDQLPYKNKRSKLVLLFRSLITLSIKVLGSSLSTHNSNRHKDGNEKAVADWNHEDIVDFIKTFANAGSKKWAKCIEVVREEEMECSMLEDSDVALLCEMGIPRMCANSLLKRLKNKILEGKSAADHDVKEGDNVRGGVIVDSTKRPSASELIKKFVGWSAEDDCEYNCDDTDYGNCDSTL
eukprot:jgi/Bigna1/139097/aug1.48_g13805